MVGRQSEAGSRQSRTVEGLFTKPSMDDTLGALFKVAGLVMPYPPPLRQAEENQSRANRKQTLKKHRIHFFMSAACSPVPVPSPSIRSPRIF